MPTSPPPVRGAADDLDNLVFAAKRQGYVIKVALIGSRADLGAVPQLFGHPQTYAKFLASELRFAYNSRLLIVMPQGFGTAHVPEREARALDGLKIGTANSDALVRTGMAAVRASAAAAGLNLPVLRPTATTTPIESAAPAQRNNRRSKLAGRSRHGGVVSACCCWQLPGCTPGDG